MEDNRIGTYHLADNPQLYEPGRSNNFEFIVTGIDELLRAGVDPELATDEDYITNGQEVLRFSVTESAVPHFELGTIEVPRGNNIMKFAGKPTFQSNTLKFNDYMGADTKGVLMAWQSLVYDVKTEKIHLAENYKKECQLIEYTPDYSKILRVWEFKGCWVKSLSEGNFNHDSEEKRQVDVTIEYDRAYLIADNR